MRSSKEGLKQAWRRSDEQLNNVALKNIYILTEATDPNLSNNSSSGDYDDNEDQLNDQTVVDGSVVMCAVKPMLLSLRLAGLYFAPRFNISSKKEQFISSQCSISDETKQQRKVDAVGRIYATIILILLWINVARSLTVFNGNESFDKTLILKISTASSALLSAISQTSLYKASVSGELEHIFRQLHTTARLARMLRNYARVRTVFIWLIFVGYYLFFEIYLFTRDELLDIFMAPFFTWIPLTDSNAATVKSLFSILFVFFILSWLLPISTTQLITDVLRNEFSSLNQRFRQAIDDKGKFHGNLGEFRRRHQHLSMLTNQADSFMKIINIGGFICHMVNVIILLYSNIIFFHKFNNTEKAVNICFLLTNFYGLLSATLNGVKVNHQVSFQAYFLPKCICLRQIVKLFYSFSSTGTF